MENTGINNTLDHLFRHESGKMVAVLSKLLGLQQMEAAQDIVQDTLLQAMSTWRYNGLPENPAAWLYRVARNKAIDYLRRQKTGRRVLDNIEWTLSGTAEELFMIEEIQDSQLRMIFAACHPSIPEESRIAFTLKTLCGLSIAEISAAFLVEQDTIAKRIYRAREKMRNGSVELEPPHGIHLTQRLDVVLKTLYLLFNEGYYSSRADDRLVREDLCREAMRLCQLLCEHRSTALPRTHALLALFSFQASRLHARLDDNGHIILLKYQDRTQWNRALIRAGFEQLERAAEPFEVTAYHLEAAIASVHAASPSFEKTDWTSIHHLYEMLYQLQPNPIVAMNKAIASSFAISNRHALSELQTIRGLEHHHLYLATLGEICLAMQEYEEARGYFEKASALAPTVAEKQLLFARVTQCRAN